MAESASKPISRMAVGPPQLPHLVALFAVTIAPGTILKFITRDLLAPPPADATSDKELSSAGARVPDTAFAVTFAGARYQAYPITAKGFAWSAEGPPARPTLEMANLLGLYDRAAENQSLLGKQVRRILTLSSELDPPHGSGGGACFPPEQWVIDRVARIDARLIRLELCAAASLENRSFPHRLILRDTCQHNYRQWDAAAGRFSYDQVTCPYRADGCFRADGTPAATPADDQCSRQLHNGCRKRFPTGSLPILAFPGVTRL